MTAEAVRQVAGVEALAPLFRALAHELAHDHKKSCKSQGWC
jgi:hypothetical protein